jgi:NAD+ kinase
VSNPGSSSTPSGGEPAAPGARPGSERFEPKGGKIRSVLLLADGQKTRVQEALGEVEAFLESRGVAVSVHPDVRSLRDGGEAVAGADVDLVVVLGGDGSVLTAANAFHARPVPTIGINFGRVGFLASLEVSAWREGLIEVFEGRAVVEHRMRLEARVRRGGAVEPAVMCAMNDVVISRGEAPKMAAFRLSSAGRDVSSYRADGLICSTPSGSTAYSLAAGGPILDPALRAMVVTPISAHALAMRPLVLDPGAELEVAVIDSPSPVSLDVDGRRMASLSSGDAVLLGAAREPYPLLTIPSFDPWQRLRDRLGWAGRLDERIED